MCSSAITLCNELVGELGTQFSRQRGKEVAKTALHTQTSRGAQCLERRREYQAYSWAQH